MVSTPVERTRITTLSLLLACGPSSGIDDTGASTTDDPPTDTSGSSNTPTTVPTTTDTTATTDATDATTGPGTTCPEGQPGQLLATTSLTEPAGMAWAQSIALGAAGEVYLTGALWDGPSSAPALTRVARDGTLLGTTLHQDIGEHGFSVGVVRASDGTLLIAGQRGGAGNGAYVANFAADGTPIGLSPLPGESGRQVTGLAINSGDHLIVSVQDEARVFWLLSISPGGDLTWEIPTATVASGPTWLTVGPGDAVAAVTGQWSAGSDSRAQVAFVSGDGNDGWGQFVTATPGNDVGRMGGVALTAGLDVLGASYRLAPAGHIELRALASDQVELLWATTLLDEPDVLLAAHGVWTTTTGAAQVLVTRHAPAIAPSSVTAHVITVAADGVTQGTLELELGLDPTQNATMEMRAVLDDCGALRIWDSPSRTLWSVQL